MNNERQHENRVQALLDMPEMSTKVLWDVVVHRGRGLNWQVGLGLRGPFLGPEQAAQALMPQHDLFLGKGVR